MSAKQTHSESESTRRAAAYRVTVTLVASVLSVAGFMWPQLLLMSLAGVILTVYLVERSRQLEMKTFARLSYLYGVVYFGFVMSWMFNVNTTALIVDNKLALVFKIISLALVVLVLAFGFVVFAYLYRGLKTRYPKLPDIVIIPVVWVVAEFFRSVFFSIFWMGAGGSIGPYWNFGSTGLLAVDTPMKYAARIVGMFGLSYLLVFCAVAIVAVSKRKLRYGLLVVLPLVLSVSGWYLYRSSTGKAVDISVVALKAGVDYGYEGRLNNLLKGQAVDTVVLPEYSYYYYSKNEAKARQLPSGAQLYIDSAAENDGSGLPYNALQYRDNTGKVLNVQRKSLLVPGGEYVPYLYEMILFYTGHRDIVGYFNTHSAVGKSPVREQPYTYNGVSYGTLVCSGVLAPNNYQKLTKAGAEVLINSASTSTLGVSKSYYLQADQMTSLIAVANARPFVQAARGGPSYIKDINGTPRVQSSAGSDIEIVTDTVTTNTRRTVYTIAGEWVLMVSLGAILGLFGFKLLRN